MARQGYHQILRRFLILIILLIVYGSLYPWHFAPAHLTASPVWILLHSWHPQPFRYFFRDTIVNIALYIPLGFAAHLVFRTNHLPGFGFYCPVLLGLVLSTAMELIQLLVPSRTTSIADVITNVVGSGCGVMMGVLFEAIASRKPIRTPRLRVADRAALMLVFCWVAWLFFPFFPTLSQALLSGKLDVFARAPWIDPVTLVSTAACWFAAGLLTTAAGIQVSRVWFALTILAIPAQFLVAGRQPVPSLMFGAIAGVVWFAIRGQDGSPGRVEAWAFLAVIVVRGLTPFHLAAQSTPFNWIPFGAVLISDGQSATSVLIEKVFFYGTAIWLIRTTGATLVRSMTLVAAVLAAIEITQTHLPGRIPEITDPILAIVTGFLLAVVSRRKLSLSPETEIQFRSAG